jgi:hypothetical protein
LKLQIPVGANGKFFEFSNQVSCCLRRLRWLWTFKTRFWLVKFQFWLFL